MGAYLHLRGLVEVDETSDSVINTGHLLNSGESACGAKEVTPAGTSESPALTRCRKELNNRTTISEMNDCSNLWAGQLDDVFEDLRVKTRAQDTSTCRMGVSGIGPEDVAMIPELDRRDEAHSRSGKIEFIQNVFIRDRIVDGVHLVDHSSLLPGFRHGSYVASSSAATLDGDKGRGSTQGYLQGALDVSDSTHSRRGSEENLEDHSERLPDHLLIELLVRVPTRDWPAAACVKKRWANLFKGDGLWHSALMKKWPGATSAKRWPGPIARGSSKRRYTALYVSDSLFAKDKVEGVNEVAGHVYLFLKEQLESPTPPVSYGLLHGTIIDQFLACCKTGDEAHNLASHIWIAVLDNLDESENTFHLLMRIAEEWEVFPGYSYSKSNAVQWRLFERLFTDFRDCLMQYNYFDILTRVRNKFEMIPQTWLGY